MSIEFELRHLERKVDHIHEMLHLLTGAVAAQGAVLAGMADGGPTDPALTAALAESRAHHDRLKAVLATASAPMPAVPSPASRPPPPPHQP